MVPLSVLRAVPGAVEADQAYLPCELCGVPRGEVLFHLPNSLDAKRRGVTFVRCRGCGLISRNPRPWSFDMVRTLTTGASLQTHRWSLRRAAASWMRSIPGRHVLVIGCGPGHLVKRLVRGGFSPVGIDLDPTGIDAAFQGAKGIAKPPVYRKPVEEAALADESFHGAALVDSLVCLPNPTRTLVEIHRVLKAGGICLVTVPNASSWGASFFKKQWELLCPATALFHFSPKTLAILVEETGFRVRSMRQISDGAAWAASLERTAKRSANAKLDRLCRTARPFLYVLTHGAAWLARAWGRGDRLVLVLEKR